MRYVLRSTIVYCLLALFSSCVCLASPSISNVQAFQQQDSSRKVKITYRLTSSSSAMVYVTVAISTNGGSTYTITPSLATGHIGWVLPGGLRTIYWDAKSQYPKAVWANCRAKVIVDDSSSGVHPGEMIYIPAGSFLMGNNGSEPYSESNELPQHSVTLAGYYIGKYEVTRGEYRAFMAATGRAAPAYWADVQDWGTGTFTQTENHPVLGVTWYDAEAYCAWAGGHLPTEAQWEKAARWTGSYPNVYPWGNTWSVEKCNNMLDTNSAGGGYGKYQTAPVGSYPSGASPYGCQDMAGNVWEWCQDWYKSYPGSSSPFDYTNSYRVLRGGGWTNAGSDDRCACRDCFFPINYYYYDILGFRLVR